MSLKNDKGFTLLELLIALILMSVISLTATQMLRSTTTKTKKLTSGMNELNRLRAVLSVMRSDFLEGFNRRDLNIFLYNQAQKERAAGYENRKKEWVAKLNKDENKQPPVTEQTMSPQEKSKMEQELGPKPQDEKPRVERVVTHFIGDKEKVYFTTSSGFRLRKENKVSELMEVGYYIQTCKSKRNPEVESDCLWRSLSYNLDGDVSKDQEGSVLLENVESFEIDFLGYSLTQGENEWFDSWDSTQVSDQRFGEKFPQGVRVRIAAEFIQNKKSKKPVKRKITGFFPIVFPNNKPFEKIKFSDPVQKAPATGTGGTSPTTPQPTQTGTPER